jgi:cell wall-associated NlpC family hydrolase
MGRVKAGGVDCGMLLLEVYHEACLIPHIEPEPYPPDWALHRSEEKYLGWVQQYAHPVDTPKPGDLALYQVGRCISHGAIVVAWPQIIHASQPEGGCCLSDGQQGWLTGRLAGFYSIW